MSSTANVLAGVVAERIRQDAKWGEQNHPNVDPFTIANPIGGDWPVTSQIAQVYQIPTSLRATFLCDRAAARGECTWAHILVEEVAEAIEAATVHDAGLLVDSTTRAELRTELIQVAAVAVAWIEKLDRETSAR